MVFNLFVDCVTVKTIYKKPGAKKPAPGILFLIVSRHADGKCFQKLKYPAVENYMYSHNVALSHSFENMFYGFE